jgi:hypothetical protein
MKARLLMAVAAAVLIAGCGSSSSSSSSKTANPKKPEASPPGDIPDNQAYVAYAPPGAGYSVKVPEGWSRSTAGTGVVFSDKLNSVQLASAAAKSRPTVATARQAQVPAGAQSVQASAVSRKAGPAVRITYVVQGKADPVTGKSRPLAVERYVFFKNGHEALLTLSGAKGADNVDPWRTVTDSLRWTR